MRRRVLCWLTLVVVAAVLLAPARADDKGAPRQQEKSFEKEVKVKVKLDYLLYLPEGYDKGDKPWPLVLFLHGLGESGSDLKKVKTHGPPKLVEAGKSFPCIIVSPQKPGEGFGWDVGAVDALLDDVIATHKVDKDRVYLTGLSMGGYGTWALAAAQPDKFAAIAPICGGGSASAAKKIKHLPIWVFHGAKDRVVRPDQSERMVNALKKAGAKDVKYTLYPDLDHDSWTATYDNPEFWEWLLQQRRGGK